MVYQSFCNNDNFFTRVILSRLRAISLAPDCWRGLRRSLRSLLLYWWRCLLLLSQSGKPARHQSRDDKNQRGPVHTEFSSEIWSVWENQSRDTTIPNEVMPSG